MMIKVHPRRAPNGFPANVRNPGRAWLKANAHKNYKRPRDYWNEWEPCKTELARCFGYRCGYTACWIPDGEVEHFVSWDACKKAGKRHLAYEWSNYRWILPRLNKHKGTQDFLDPFDVEDDWFEVDIFTLHLRMTSKVPKHMIDKAKRTMKKLGLERDPRILGTREEALARYRGGSPVAEVERFAPLVGRALRRLLEAEKSALTAGEWRLRTQLVRAHNRATKR